MLDRRGHGLDEPFGEPLHDLGGFRIVRQRTDELVAADAGEDAAFGQQAPDPFGNRGQHQIARRVAVDVVDMLETIEIDHQHRYGPVAALGGSEQGIDRRIAAAPVEAAGKRVGFRQLARQGFRAAALADLALEIGVTPPAEDEQGDVEQDRVGQQHVWRGAFAHPRADGLRHHRPAGGYEQDHRGHGDTERDHVTLGLAETA